MPDRVNFTIDAASLQAHIDDLGEIGRTDDGLFRPVYGTAWRAARDRVEAWMREAGLRTHVDAVGNLFGRLDGRDVDAPVVLSGSHIDTVRNAGKYDGALGIHAALAAVRAIKESAQVPRRGVEVVALCEEEGSRFANPMWGTQAILGLTSTDVAQAVTDEDGISIAGAMRDAGLDPAMIPAARRDDIAAFVELHIEQGGTLERDGVALGVVAAITGQRHLIVDVRGQQNHAGTTPMGLRRDALAGGCEVVLAIESIALSAGDPAVATVGMLDLEPGSRNVIPGRVTFTVDVRHPDAHTLDRLVAAIRDASMRTGSVRGVEITVEEVHESHKPPVVMDERLRATIERCAQLRGVRAEPMVSGAGHDSQVFAERVPTAMIFAPSAGGISHSPDEYTPIDEIVPCVEVLADVLWCAAEGTDEG